MIYIGTRVSQLAVEIYDDKALHFCNVDVKPFERGAIYRLIPVLKQFRRNLGTDISRMIQHLCLMANAS